MADEPTLSPRDPDDAREAVALALAQLGEVRAALANATGGASPALVLAELAQEMAGDLAAYFDDLRMHRFTGSLARAPGFVGALVPGRRMAHRVVLARYVSASQPLIETGGYALRSASIALVALGADGVLRTGRVVENVRIPSGTVLDDKPLAWDSPLVRRVPSRVMRLVRWPGGRVHVATPAQVLDALAAIATQLAADSRRDLALLQRLLPPP